MKKVILFYKFFPVAEPEVMRLWQKTLCEKLNLKGRIIIADHGINGTLGGDLKDLKAYVKAAKTYLPFKGMSFKWSDGQGEVFPKLSVKVRAEIVTFGVSDKIKVDDQGIVGSGKHLNPKQVHDLVAKRGEDVVFFDGRNAYEAAVGKFQDAVIPAVRHTREFKSEIKDSKYDELKDRPVITYCTGGIRCEVLSMLMKNEGFKEVYQIDGGIVKYGEKYGDKGLWEGALYVFDDRLTTKSTDVALDIGECSHCTRKTSNFVNCANIACNDLILICDKCKTDKTSCVACTAHAAI